MPEDTKAVHPGSFVGDSVEEFKKLPTWGKVLAAVALAVVAYLAWRAHQAAGTASTAAPAAGTTAGQQSPYPNVNGLPLLPSNVNPLLDSSGQPYAYQQAPALPLSPVVNTNNPLPTDTSMNGPGSTTPHPSTAGIPLWQQLHVAGPLIPSGQYAGPSFSNLKPGTTYNYNGTTYKLTTAVPNNPGSGLLYGINPQGQTVALYGPPSAYRPH